MRILIATPLYPPDVGGPATDAACMKETLPTFGVSVDMVPFSRVRHLPRGIRHLKYFMLLFMRAFRADTIIAMDTVSVGLPAVFAAALTGRPLVVRIPGDYAWEQGKQRFGIEDSLDEFQLRTYSWRVEFLRRVQRFVVRSATMVLVPSRYFEGVVSHWGIKSDRVRCLYLGVDLPPSIETPKHVLAGHIMVSAGRLVPWKGFSMLIGLLPTLPDWNLVIVGDGPERMPLEQQAKKLGVQGRVLFTGALSRKKMLGWCKVADAFVLNTSFESFSFQIVEAMMVGVPVITTRIGSIPELIDDDKEGVLLAPNDAKAFKEAIASIKSDPEKWHERTRAAQHKAQQFSTAVAMYALAEALKHICA
ncbi:MAG TPA: glycosyltransferase [Candidatus Paceibacterota bacterium]|nr:glycosyltransferase [Candidatus Paceibacterota bacterium]